MPKGRLLKAYLSYGVTIVVKNLLSSVNFTCQKVELQSNFVKYLDSANCPQLCSMTGSGNVSRHTLSFSLVNAYSNFVAVGVWYTNHTGAKVSCLINTVDNRNFLHVAKFDV